MQASADPGAAGAAPSARDHFLAALDREHATTMRVLRAYPSDRLDLRPHERCKTARELAWVFVLERGLGTAVYTHQLEQMMASGAAPEPPEDWDELLGTLEEANAEFRALIESTPDERMHDPVRFFVAPHTLGDIPRIEWLWFLLHDEIHHRGQFSVYLRMADARVPSIYGPSGDEPWM